MDDTCHLLQVTDALDGKFSPPGLAQEQLGFRQVRGQDSSLREQPGSESMQSVRRKKLGTSRGYHYLDSVRDQKSRSARGFEGNENDAGSPQSSLPDQGLESESYAPPEHWPRSRSCPQDPASLVAWISMIYHLCFVKKK